MIKTAKEQAKHMTALEKYEAKRAGRLSNITPERLERMDESIADIKYSIGVLNEHIKVYETKRAACAKAHKKFAFTDKKEIDDIYSIAQLAKMINSSAFIFRDGSHHFFDVCNIDRDIAHAINTDAFKEFEEFQTDGHGLNEHVNFEDLKGRYLQGDEHI